VLTNDQIAAYVEVGYEQRAIEFKSSGSRADKSFRALITRAALALANQRDGGHVIIGYSENGLDAEGTGLTDVQVAEWMSFDDVSDQINAYADPPLRLQVAKGELSNGKPVVVLEVSEFDEVPILCKKDFQPLLSQGQLYTRSMAKPESSSFNTQNELREVLALATEKQLRRFIDTSRRVGIDPGATESATDQFSRQLATVVGHGDVHWDSESPNFVAEIRPSAFDVARVDYAALDGVVRDAAVLLGGGAFPVIQDVRRGDDWIGGDSRWLGHTEIWQFFRSGLFVDYQGLAGRGWNADWAMSPGKDVKQFLAVWFPVQVFTQAFEFAARLQRVLAPDGSVSIKLSLNNIDGAALVANDQRRTGFIESYIYRDARWERERLLSKSDSIAGTRGIVVDLCMELFARFGWSGVSEEMIRGMQDQAFGTQE
jgi:hypothetical protein